MFQVHVAHTQVVADLLHEEKSNKKETKSAQGMK